MNLEQTLTQVIAHLSKGEYLRALDLVEQLDDLPQAEQAALQKVSSPWRSLEADYLAGVVLYEFLEEKRRQFAPNLRVELDKILSHQRLSLHVNLHKIGGSLGRGFVGRHAELERLAECRERPGGSVVVLNGMDGMGKTQLAIEHAHVSQKAGHFRNLVWWIQAEDSMFIRKGLAEIFDELGISGDGSSLDSKMLETLNWLNTNEDWLLVFDNLKDEETLRSFMPEGVGQVLLISTSQVWSDFLQPEILKIGALDLECIASLLMSKCPGKYSPEKANLIAHKLEDHSTIEVIMGADYYSKPMHSLETMTLESVKAFNQTHPLNERRESLMANIWRDVSQDTMSGLAAKAGCGFIVLGFSWLAPGRSVPKELIREWIRYIYAHMAMPKRHWLFGALNRSINARLGAFGKRAETSMEQLLNSMLNGSFLTLVDNSHFAVNASVQSFFQGLKQPFSNPLKRFSLDDFAEFLAKKLIAEEEPVEQIEASRTLLPHAMSVLDKSEAAGYLGSGVLGLCRRIYDYSLLEGDILSAKSFALRGMELEKKRYGKSSVATQNRYTDVLLMSGEHVELKAFLQEDKEADGAHLAEIWFKKGTVSEYAADALECFEKAFQIGTSMTQPDENLSLYYLQAALVCTGFDLEKSESYLRQADEWKARFTQENPEAEALYLSMKALVLMGIAEYHGSYSDEYETLREQTYNMLKNGYETCATKFREHHALTVILANARVRWALFFEDDDEAGFCSRLYEKYGKKWEKHLGNKSQHLYPFKLAQAKVANSNGDLTAKEKLIEEAIEIIEHNFPNQPDHPDRQLALRLMAEN